MLKDVYKTDLLKTHIQYIVVSKSGQVLESDNALFNLEPKTQLAHVHSFFQTLTPLLNQKKKETEFTCVHLSISGVSITADIVLKTFSNSKQPLLAVVDLTKHYATYQRIAQTRNESIIQNEFIALKHDYLEQKEAFKDIFIKNFSRNLRDPISGILTFLELLERSCLTAEQHDYLKVIKSSSYYLKQLIDDILDISKIEAGELELKPELINFKELLQEVSLTQREKAKRKDIILVEAFDQKLPETILADPIRLKQILNNLLDNAIKFTEKGQVTFKVSLNQFRAHKASIHFKIMDTGIGLDQHQLAAIFNKLDFNKFKNKNKSTGLGLNITKHLVELMGSDIDVKSKLNDGSVFSTNIQFKVPLGSQKDTEASRVKKEFRLPKNNGEKFNVLLADDSELIQVTVLKVLANDGNFYVDISSDTNSLIKQLDSDMNFDVVLIDSKLLGSTEVEAKKLLKHASNMPVVVLASEFFEADVKLYQKLNLEVIKKPFTSENLLDKLYKKLQDN